MRDLVKKILVGIVLLISPSVFAENYKVLVIPDNIVTESIEVDSFIYNASSEFFADEIITLLNTTDSISSPTVSETRNLYKQDPVTMVAAKNMTSRFRTTYNIDYVSLKKLANKSDSRYVLLMTTYIDSQNYILRRTVWDFLNIPGATVVDPAYKISTYAVLVDTEKNSKLWSDTFYKTISVCENRIITQGPSPQTEQLQKIKDYSRYICPQIAQNVQLKVLPAEVLAGESTKIDYDMGNIDNVFTKKYRHYGKETNKFYQDRKSDVNNLLDTTKEKIDKSKKDWQTRKLQKQEAELQSKLEVKATPVYENEQKPGINEISDKTSEKTDSIKNAIFKKKKSDDIQYPELIEIEIKKKKKNNLFGDYTPNQPELRGYY